MTGEANDRVVRRARVNEKLTDDEERVQDVRTGTGT
jgi:hypothetical protein